MAVDICNNLDDNCDNQIDEEGCLASCQQWLNDGYTTSGEYLIDPDGAGAGEDPIEVYCDMTNDNGGWTLLWYVDANHFDGWLASNYTSNSVAPTAINTQADMWNANGQLVFSEMIFGCTTQNDADLYWWAYNDIIPYTWFTGTYDYEYQNLSHSKFFFSLYFQIYLCPHH